MPGQFGFSDFSMELGDFEMKKSRKHLDRLHSVTFGGSVHSIPVVSGDMVIFCCADHHVYAVDVRTGKEAWSFKARGIMAGNSPELHEGTVYAGTMAGDIHALDAETGKELWEFRAGGGVTTKPLFYLNMIYFGSLDGYLYCLDMNGKELWRFRTGDEIFFPPAEHEGRIYFGSDDGYFYCIDSVTGKEIWKFKTGDEVINEAPASFHEGKVYFGSIDGHLYVLNADTGRMIWKTKSGKYGNCFSPVFMGDMILNASRDGIFYALDMNGKEIWRFRTGGVIGVTAALRKGKIYFGSEDGNMYCLNGNGKELWRFKTSGPAWSPPVFLNKKACFGSWDCHLYCADAETGEKVWSFPTSTQVTSNLAPPYEAWKAEIKTEAHEPESEGEREINVGDTGSSEYSTGSEYSVKSEYVIETGYG